MITKINEEIKNAMMNKDTSKRDVLRAIKSSANLMAKENHTEITNEHVISAIKKEIKTLNGTVVSMEMNPAAANAVADAKYRISILEAYLPKMMTKEEVMNIAENIIKTLENPNMGTAMKAVMSELKGKADGKMISSVVSEILK